MSFTCFLKQPCTRAVVVMVVVVAAVVLVAAAILALWTPSLPHTSCPDVF